MSLRVSPRVALLAALSAAACARERPGLASPAARVVPAATPTGRPICRFSLPAGGEATIAVEPGTGLPGFDVRARDATLSPARGGGWEAEVRAPLAFRGSTAEPELVTTRALDRGGVVHLQAGRRVDSVHLVRSEAGLVGRVWLVSRGDEPTSLEIAVDPAPFVCADLRVPRFDEDAARDLHATDIWSPVQMADFGLLALGDAPAGPVRATVRGAGLFVHVLERRGNAAHVVSEWSDGSRVRGWVDAAALREPEPEERMRIGRAMGGLAELDILGSLVPLSPWMPPGGLLGGGPFRRPRISCPREDPPTASTRIAAGSAVYATPGRGAWATVAGDAIFRVGARPSCAWVWIDSAPGLVLPPLRAWVRVDTLR
jgi:hypothetical protein